MRILKKLAVIASLIIVLIIFGSSLNKPNVEYQKIDPATAYQRLQQEKEIILLDVRTEAEYKERHIPGSVLLPLDRLQDGIAEITKDKDAKIFVYCRSGNRSAQAAGILTKMGYRNVYDLGGIIDWKYETQSG